MRQRLYWHKETSSWEPIPPVSAQRVHLISDDMDYLQSQATGKRFTSKSKYRADLKARGMIEVGNEKLEHRMDPIRTNIADDLARRLER